uniref:DNA/RNA-binding protein Alba-like domain-containing protein n=1 Tax=Anopheles atroparvus TaxID=41427 RepID=A0AAG5D6A7_ANOAO
MMHYKKGKNVEEDLSKELIPIEVLPERFLWMQVKGGTHVPNVVEYAKKAFDDGTYRAVVWTGADGGVGKTVSCAEIMKRHFELHQVTRVCYRKVEEFWDPQQDGLEQIVAKRNIPCVHILLSLDEIDPGVPGYQHSKTQGGFWLDADGPRKRPQGAAKNGFGDKRGNYFSGPQLNRRGNRHYDNATNEDGRAAKGKPRGGTEGGAGGSRKKGKPGKDDAVRKPKDDAASKPTDGASGGGGRPADGKSKKQKPRSSAEDNIMPMDTSEGGTTRKEKPAGD